MIPPDLLPPLAGQFGLWIVAGAATVEGPIVTVFAAFLAHDGILPLWPLAAVLLAGDLIGDGLHYALGRYGLARIPVRWRRRLGLGSDRMAWLVGHFGRQGARTLVVAKMTHSMGAAVLVAAGMARMPLGPFLVWNTLAGIPKTAAFMALGWYAGGAWRAIELWLGRGALAMMGLLIAAGAVFWLRRVQWRRA
ncbi:MAG: DedA family protein [Qingshengfaniella sp.]